MSDVGANFWERLQSAHIHRCSQTNNNMDCFRLFIPNSIRKLQKKKSVSNGTEPPPTKVEGFSGLERLRRTVGSFPTEVGGFKPDFWKMN